MNIEEISHVLNVYYFNIFYSKKILYLINNYNLFKNY